MATLQEQRDALAKVVARAWKLANDDYSIDPDQVQTWMVATGLAIEIPANDDEAEQYGVEVRSTFYRLTRLGHDALDGVK